MPSERPNFYLLLDLDPAVDDWPSIERRLVEKRHAWSRDRMGSPKAKRRAAVALALIEEIASVLENPQTRRQEAQEAVRQQQRERRERDRELDEAIALIKTGGGSCGEEQVAKLAGRFAGAATSDEIRRRLVAAGVALESAAAGKRKPRSVKVQIEKSMAVAVRKLLDHLGLGTLYDFLDLPPRASPKALADRADEIYKENLRLGRTDSEATARNELAGTCATLFGSDLDKEKYDNYLAIEAMESLKPNLEIAGADNFLTREEIDALLRQALQRGVSAEDARAYIEDHAAARGWKVQQGGTELPAATLQRCGFCSALAPAAAATCADCGRSLKIDCPRCGARSPSASAACERCGCRIGDAPLVQALLAEGERLAVGGDLAAALLRFDKALLYWPDWQPAVEARRRTEETRRQRETEIAAVERLVRERKLVAARSELGRCARLHGTAGLDALERQVREGLARTEAAFMEGERRRRAGDGEGALDRYEESLAVCADFEAALRAMAASPPPPPAALHVAPIAAGFRLSWQASATGRGVTYRVIRRAGGVPRSSEDGEVLGDVRITSLDDAGAPVGAPFYYAVFALRGGVSCLAPANSGPHLRLAEVQNLELTPGQGEVTLRWTPPSGCQRVEVWRRQGTPPAGPGDGTSVVVAGAGAHDSGLANHATYGYRVVTVFTDPGRPAAELRTAGRTATATPVAPPAPVADLRVSRRGKTVLLSWTPIAGAVVQIRQTACLPEYVPGLILPASQVDRFGCLVSNSKPSEVQVTLTEQGRLFFVPLSVAAGTAVAGGAVEVTTLDSVTQLTARYSAANLVLTWEWPNGTEEALVAWAHDRYPEETGREHGSRTRVTRREYDRAGCWQLRHPERCPHYLCVFAKAPGADLYAPAARVFESSGQGVAVAYRVVVRKSLLRRAIEDAWVELTRGGGADGPLPALLVVGKAQNVPLSPLDGDLLAEVPALRFERGRATLPIPACYWPANPYVKLFFKDAAVAREIRLLPAEKERLQIA